MKMRHPLVFGFLPLFVLLVGLAVLIGLTAVPMIRYNHRSSSIREKIRSLEKRRPATVSPQLWEECVGWVCTAHGNICFSEGQTSYQAMCQFEKQLDEKLRGDIDLGTIEWIGNRLAETGPHGQRYVADWRKQWEALLQEGKQN